MSIFFFLNERTTTLATSLSRPGRIFGSASRIVTSAPRSANVEANSQPIAPPPITATRFGTVSMSSTSSLVMIGPPRSKLGISRGTEPVARITVVARDLDGAAIVERHGDDTVGPEAADAVEHLDLAVLAHRPDAADESGDDLLLALLGHGEVDLRRARLDPEVGGVVDVAVHRGGLQERLGRDAPTVETGAAEGVLLHQRGLQSGRGGIERLPSSRPDRRRSLRGRIAQPCAGSR